MRARVIPALPSVSVPSRARGVGLFAGAALPTVTLVDSGPARRPTRSLRTEAEASRLHDKVRWLAPARRRLLRTEQVAAVPAAALVLRDGESPCLVDRGYAGDEAQRRDQALGSSERRFGAGRPLPV